MLQFADNDVTRKALRMSDADSLKGLFPYLAPSRKRWALARRRDGSGPERTGSPFLDNNTFWVRQLMNQESHQPVLATAAVAALAIRDDGWYLDATFGRGGHSELILQPIGPGRTFAGDRQGSGSSGSGAATVCGRQAGFPFGMAALLTWAWRWSSWVPTDLWMAS